MRHIAKIIVCAGVMLAAAAQPATAASRNGDGPVSTTLNVRDGGDGPATERVTLGLNKAAIIELPADASDVLVSNPAIVDAIVRTPRRIYILGLTVGQTNAFFFSDSGKQLLNLEIRVERDIVSLSGILAQHFPNAQIKAESINDNIVLTGIAPSASIAEQARELAVRYVGAPEKVLNMITVSGREQVMIRVRVAEMQRVVAKQLGVDLKAMAIAGGVPLNLTSNNEFSLLGRALGTGNATAGMLPGQLYNPYDLTCNGEAPTGEGASLPCAAINNSDAYNNVEGTVRAMERAGVLKLLSEPNLTAISGETANFMAGGEFPVPSGIDDSGNVRIEFKSFGVGLAFTPVVLSEGRINLKVSSEVSELTAEGSLVIPGRTVRDANGELSTVNGMTIPGLRVRRAETSIELPSGGSMMMAGLLRDDYKQNIDGYPGLKDLPVLGALFRSRDYQMNQTELVVIVSAILVDPVSGKELTLPTTGFVPATDAQTILNGQTNATYTTKTVPAPAGTPPAGGYIIE
ncbi:Type 3 secretion system secretin [Alphaproteobacteria bacterium SO-S41]|nr:Type 3 secretion system secretin [Alphaproteobacteria bacterium SO-S41]